MPKRGLPQSLETEIIEALVPILKKYWGMRKSHLSRDRIGGICYSAYCEALHTALYSTDAKPTHSPK